MTHCYLLVCVGIVFTLAFYKPRQVNIKLYGLMSNSFIVLVMPSCIIKTTFTEVEGS